MNGENVGLFDIFDGGGDDTSAKSTIGNFSIKKTDNIPKMLKQVAKESGMSLADIDFDIIKTHTHATIANQSEAISEGAALQDEALLRNPDLSIRQIYEVNVQPLKRKKDFDLVMQITVNKSFSRAKGIIKKESRFVYTPVLEETLIREINKRKLRNGILIDLFDEKMREGIKTLATRIRVKDTLEEDYVIELCHWLDPVLTVDDAIVLHESKDKKKVEEDTKKVDYRERGFISTIEEGEVAAEYIKPRQGIPGRNFRGEFIPSPEPKVTHEPKFVVDVQTVDAKETVERIQYIAKMKGYVRLDDKELRISDTLEINEASFRSTGNINAEQDKDIKISLKGKDKHEDNIGPNTKIQASEITVEGSVANGAEVRAEIVKISGQTHKTSKIYAGDAQIDIHRGYLEAKKAVVRQLENGEIVADEIHIAQMIGGTVRGKRIEIGTLLSNARITASREVVILNPMKGSDNHIIIEAGATEAEQKKIAGFMGEMKELEAKIAALQKKFLDKKRQVRQAQESTAQLKDYILQAKKEGRKPSQTHIDRYKKFMEVMTEVKEMQEDLELLEAKMEKDKDEIMLIQDAALHAKITNMHAWTTHNKIYYKLINPPETIEYIPKIGMKAGTLVLKMVGENEFNVEVVYL
jgi:hypothetical protein